MKNSICSIIFILFLHSITFSQSTHCTDSVKSVYYYHNNMNGIIYQTSIDTFNLDSGIVTHCVGDIYPSPVNPGNFSCTQSFWSKNFYTYNGQGKTTEILLRVGSSNGWRDSARTTFMYDAINGFLINESHENWDGAAWSPTILYTWTYDTSNKLIDQTNQHFLAGATNNIEHVSWNYSGDTLINKTIQIGNGAAWVDNYNYSFYYDSNGNRDSVLLQIWNTNTSVWDTIGFSPYTISNGRKVASFTTLTPVTINASTYTDTTRWSIDTLENTLYLYDLLPYTIDAMGVFYSMTLLNFIYVNNNLLIEQNYNADWFDDGINGLSWYCTNNNLTSSYDSSAFLTMTIQRARCVMPREYTTIYTYDSNHNLIKLTGNLDSGVSYDDYSYNLYYATADSMIAYFAPTPYTFSYNCPGNTLQPFAQGLGGCGNHSYHWSPSTGLSSDTIQNPVITIGDAINYTITISDTTGHSTNLNYAITPAVQAIITLDTNSCIGCIPTLITSYSNQYNYQWFLDGTLIPNSDTSNFNPTQTGNYYVVITELWTNCIDTSNSIYFISTTDIFSIVENIISIQPNPTSDYANLKLANFKNEFITIQLFNITGQLQKTIFQGKTGNTKEFNLLLEGHQFSKGLYLIGITSDSFHKFIRWEIQ